MLWHERLTAGPDGERAARALLDLAATLGLAEIDGAGLLEVPAQPTAAACARPACCRTPARVSASSARMGSTRRGSPRRSRGAS